MAIPGNQRYIGFFATRNGGRPYYTSRTVAGLGHGTYFIYVVLLLPPEQPLKREVTNPRLAATHKFEYFPLNSLPRQHTAD
jgi:hypothetical protein